jgi:hypothetical protein
MGSIRNGAAGVARSVITRIRLRRRQSDLSYSIKLKIASPD